MGKKGKGKQPPPSNEEIDIERYRVNADIANWDARRVRSLYERKQLELQQSMATQREQAAEREDLYEYVDAQMLHTARDRLANEIALRQFQTDADRERASLQQRLGDQERSTASTITKLRAELAERTAELEYLVEFRGKRATMEAELVSLREQLAAERESRKQYEHERDVEAWRQREALNAEMLKRITRAKAAFLEITSEMLDSTVHRTMLENQNMSDELQALSARLDGLLHENLSLMSERASLSRELELQRQQEVTEVRRSLARRKLAETATERHEALSRDLELARSDLAVAHARATAHEATIRKQQLQLQSAERRVGALTARVREQQSFIERRFHQHEPPEPVPYPDWSHVFPQRGSHVFPQRGSHGFPQRGSHGFPQRGSHGFPQRGRPRALPAAAQCDDDDDDDDGDDDDDDDDDGAYDGAYAEDAQDGAAADAAVEAAAERARAARRHATVRQQPATADAAACAPSAAAASGLFTVTAAPQSLLAASLRAAAMGSSHSHSHAHSQLDGDGSTAAPPPTPTVGPLVEPADHSHSHSRLVEPAGAPADHAAAAPAPAFHLGDGAAPGAAPAPAPAPTSADAPGDVTQTSLIVTKPASARPQTAPRALEVAHPPATARGTSAPRNRGVADKRDLLTTALFEHGRSPRGFHARSISARPSSSPRSRVAVLGGGPLGHGLGGGALGYLTGQRPSSAAPAQHGAQHGARHGAQHPIYAALQNLQPTAAGAAGGGACACAGAGAVVARETSAQYGAGRETRSLADSAVLIIQSAEIAPAPKSSKGGAAARGTATSTSSSTPGTRISARISQSAAAPGAAPAAAAPPSPEQEQEQEERLEERVLGMVPGAETETDAGAASEEGRSEALVPTPAQDDAES